MNTVASECVVQKHHPEWSNVSFPSPYLSSYYYFRNRVIRIGEELMVA
jgi:hypothetical protein